MLLISVVSSSCTLCRTKWIGEWTCLKHGRLSRIHCALMLESAPISTSQKSTFGTGVQSLSMVFGVLLPSGDTVLQFLVQYAFIHCFKLSMRVHLVVESIFFSAMDGYNWVWRRLILSILLIFPWDICCLVKMECYLRQIALNSI